MQMTVVPSSEQGDLTIWHVDQCMLNVKVVCKGSSGELVTCRPWLTLIVDEHTRAICGAWVSTEPPSAETIQNVLLTAIQDIRRSDAPHAA